MRLPSRLLAALCAGAAHATTATDALTPGEAAVYRGMDAPLSAETFGGYSSATLLDHEGRDVRDPSLNMSGFAERCQNSLKRAIWEEERGLPPYVYVDPLEGVAVGERAQPNDPRVVYFIGVTRASGAAIASRLMLALHHSSHLYLIHVDLKADKEVYFKLAELTKDHPNIRLLSTRRLVQWGGFTMVATMLDAVASVVARNFDFDFFINLSDADISLRTNAEVMDFLRPYKGRQFVQVHAGNGEWLERARNFTGAHAVVECGGYGFVSFNDSR